MAALATACTFYATGGGFGYLGPATRPNAGAATKPPEATKATFTGRALTIHAERGGELVLWATATSGSGTSEALDLADLVVRRGPGGGPGLVVAAPQAALDLRDGTLALTGGVVGEVDLVSDPGASAAKRDLPLPPPPPRPGRPEPPQP